METKSETQNTSQNFDTKIIELKKYHDVFLGNLMLILDRIINKTSYDNFEKSTTDKKIINSINVMSNNFDLRNTIQYINENKESIDFEMLSKYITLETRDKLNESLSKLKVTSINFLDSIKNGNLTMDGVSGVVKKLFNIISANMELLINKDIKLFQLKTQNQSGKMVTQTIIPGLDIIYGYYTMNTESRDQFWRYLESLYIVSYKMINLVNDDSDNLPKMGFIKEINYELLKKEFVESYPEQTVVTVSNLDFDPYLGVGVSGDNYGLNDMINTINTVDNTQSAPGLGSMAKMLGVDKMMGDLSKHLKNIDKKDIDEATKNIKNILGSNVDENTSNMIGDILSDITSHLKMEDISDGDPIQNIIKIAESVAQKTLPKIDKNKVDMKKIWESTQNLATSYKDKDGKPILAGGNNPLSLLTGFMQSQMNNMNSGNGGPSADQMKMAESMLSGLMGGDKNNKNKKK